MKIKIEIDTSNAAFGETDDERGEEVGRILADLARYVAEVGVGRGSTRSLRDINGNVIGKLKT